MSTQKESSVSNTLMKHLHKMLPKSFWTKVHMTAMQPALLDIIGVWKGHYITIEVKMLGEQLTPRQRIVALMQEHAGAIVLKFERNPGISFNRQAQMLADEIRTKILEKERDMCNERTKLGGTTKVNQ
jgi:hypothetical protein